MNNHKVIARYPRQSAIVFTVLKVGTVTVLHCKMADSSLGITWWIKFTWRVGKLRMDKFASAIQKRSN
jgi:hypothetical protein